MREFNWLRRKRACRVAAVALGMLLLILGLSPATVSAQTVRSTLPSNAYFAAFRPFYDADYQRAVDAFQASGRLGRQSVDGRWVDGVCYHTMIGECLYRMGRLEDALEQYNTATRIFLRHRKWMLRVQFPEVITPAQVRLRDGIVWAIREPAQGRFTEYSTLFGDLNAGAAFQTGGVVARPELRTVHVAEIMRCLAIATQRRAELLGPLSRYEKLTTNLWTALESPLVPQNHWSQAWVEVVRGMVLSALGKEDDAQLAWRRGSLVQGYDHPLTGLALLSLGRAALADGQAQIAEELCLQAGAAAAEFGQFDLVAECFNQLNQLHLQGALNEEHAAFAQAIAWASRQRARVLRSQLLLDVSEQLLALNRTAEAAKVLSDAMKGQGRRARISAQQAAKQSLVQARVNYRQDKLELGDRAIAKALEWQRQVSTRQFQIETADRFYRSGSERLTPRAASFLYANLLREPTANDWQQHLLDTLVFQTSPLTASFENWFEVALERNEDRAAVDVIQALKRHRFLSQLPLGGRLLSLRWVLEAPATLIDAASQARRDELLLRFPEYAELSREARGLREDLIAEIGQGEDGNAKTRLRLSKQLTEMSGVQESVLGDIALRNEFVPIAFPPRRTVQEVQLRLNPAQVIWGFCEVSDGLFSYMVSSKYVAVWEVDRPRQTMKAMGELLGQLGMRGPNQPMTIAQLMDPRWEATAGDVLNSLLEPQQRGFWNRFEELIIVPDGRLWYFPFEVAMADGEMLIDRMRIRYAPLLSLAVTTEQPPHRAVETVTALGQLFPREADEVTRDHFEQMQRVVDDLVLMPETAAGPMRVAWQRLLVLDDIRDFDEGPLGWAPARVDQGKPGSMVADWIRLPWGSPAQVLVPGFHTAAESGGMKGTGQEVFNTLMALMSTGTRTVILSRWRTGGETSYDLMREWLQECDVSSAAEAWQRAVHVVRDSELDAQWEPRVTSRAEDPVIQAEHPFLWAGYLVVDTGVGTPAPLPRKPDDTKTAAE